MRRALLTLCALLTGAPLFAQASQQAKAYFVSGYDLDATSYTYCVTTGKLGDPWGPARESKAQVETSGSSTTVTAVVADSLPFADLGVGDVLYFQTAPGTTALRYITAKASGDSITVSSAIDLSAGSGFNFTWRDVACGTTAADGWINVSGYDAKIVTYIENLSVDAGGMDFRWECRDHTDDTNIITVYPETNYAAEDGAGPGGRAVVITEPWDQCRVGMKLTDDDNTDTGADIEIIHAYIVRAK